MTSYYKLVLFLFNITQFVDFVGSYYISADQRRTYENKQCRLAVPKRIPCSEKDGECVEINDDLNLNHDDMWIGYYRSEIAFEYIGCVKESDIPGNQNSVKYSINGELGACYKLCQKSKAVGVTLEDCYCFNASFDSWNRNLLRSVNCNDVCVNPDSVACGGKYNNERFASLYQINPIVLEEIKTKPSDKGTSMECLEFKPSKEHLKWKDCSDNKDVTCANGAQSEDDKQWLEAAQFCFRSDSSLMSYLVTQSPRNEGRDSIWTGVFKINTIYKEGLTDSSTPIENRHIKTTPPSQETNTDAAVIALSVVLIVVIIAVVTGVFIYRRYRYSRRFVKMADTSRPEAEAEAEYNYPEFAYDNKAIDSNNPDSIVYNYPEFSIQETDGPGEIGNELDSCETNYSVAAEDNHQSIDTENAKHVYNQPESDASYNVIGRHKKTVPCRTYGNTGSVNKLGTSSPGETAYDISLSPDVRLKIIHQGPTDNVYNTENNTYNRLDDESVKHAGKTDNLYGTKQMEKYNVHDETYNTTSEKCTDIKMTDNPYSKLGAE